MSPASHAGRIQRLQQLCADLDALQGEVRTLCAIAHDGIVQAHERDQIIAIATNVKERAEAVRDELTHLTDDKV